MYKSEGRNTDRAKIYSTARPEHPANTDQAKIWEMNLRARGKPEVKPTSPKIYSRDARRIAATMRS